MIIDYYYVHKKDKMYIVLFNGSMQYVLLSYFTDKERYRDCTEDGTLNHYPREA
jgi:hypothetical protein